MKPSSTLCRAQEAYHRDRAAGTQLDNVRVLATNAAIAWGQEAVAAERREARYERTKTLAAIISAEKQQSHQAGDCLVSENPDRDFGNP